MANKTREGAHALRILTLPLSKRPPLSYFLAQRLTDPASAIASTAHSSEVRTQDSKKPGDVVEEKKKDVVKPPLLNRITDWGGRQWSNLGKAPKSNWKYKTYMLGERLMDRIDFEEWSLKGLDPALAPSPWNRRRRIESSDKEKDKGSSAVAAKEIKESDIVPLLYPPSFMAREHLMSHLRSHLAYREPHHRKYMWYCLIGAPLTTPFALIPVIPNFPLFYLLWRAWSHWRAWKSSQYLNKLLENDLLVPTESPELDEIYKSRYPVPPQTESKDQDSLKAEEAVLLKKDMIPALKEKFGLDDKENEITRAVEQAAARLKSVEGKKKAE